MCLILLALGVSARFPLVLVGNRDEYYERPTAPADFWAPQNNVLGGRDLGAGGTWLAVSRQGRLATVTNHRDGRPRPAPRSRGHLVSAFVDGSAAAADHLAAIAPAHQEYGGFNLLLWDGTELRYGSNRGAGDARVTPGVHGLSNDLLDTPWPKVVKGKQRLANLLQEDQEDLPAALFDLLGDRTEAPDHALPSMGVSLEWERRLSAAFIQAETYGTRASTVVLVDGSGTLTFAERSFDCEGRIDDERHFRIENFLLRP